jgi:hypothetical protein
MAGCHGNNKESDTSSFKAAINDYYRTHTVCVWSDAVKFPAQVDSSDDNQTKGFDALTDGAY